MSDVALVYGVGVAGMATAAALVKRGYTVVAADDHADEGKAAALRGVGVELRRGSLDDELLDLVASVDFVAPAPGIPESHPVIVEAIRQGVPLRSELDLAYAWERERPDGPRPMVAVTGTDGKTTTVSMAEEILTAGGCRPVACGNTEIPLVEAIDLDVDVFVVEATSFRLAFAEEFRAVASAWINLAPDHLDWHSSMSSYEAAKARLWRGVEPGDTAIGFADDPVVMAHLRQARCRQVTFAKTSADYCLEGTSLRGPTGTLMDTRSMQRALPHDITNALAASALVLESGLVSTDSVERALSTFVPPHHRIELIAEHRGVRWFDDSKATTPHAAVTAIRGFESVVLIAGGRNKGLDLSAMASESQRIRAVVALGEAAPEIESVFGNRVPVTIVASMEEAVEAASRRAVAPDVVLLSPGCTSLDWYTGYAARGDDFARHVAALISDSRSVASEDMIFRPGKGRP
ncbi:MAG: UDP-N-acetylmuramoyl-L-alanine--D-glutamate ligase [Ilumatobacteraceae bacterium]